METEHAINIDLRARFAIQLEFDYSTEVTFQIGPASVRLYEQDYEGEPQNMCEVRLSRPVSPELFTTLNLIAERRIPEGTDRSNKSLARALKRANPDGSLAQPVPFDALPLHTRGAIRELRDELSDTAQILGRAIRWRLGSGGSHRTMSPSGRQSWSVDNGRWHDLPGGSSTLMMFPARYPTLDEALRSEIESIATSAQSEPVAHAILREASENATRNVRSSLVLCIVALEVGAKAFIGKLVPDAAWLADFAPAPPIPKMIAIYLPTLAGKDGRLLGRAPTEVMKLIGDAVEARNVVTHRGQKAWSTDSQRRLLRTTRAFLYALDYVSGTDWAANVLTAEELDVWGLTPAPEGRGAERAPEN